MAAVKMNWKVDAKVWKALRAFAEAPHVRTRVMLTEAKRDNVRRRRVRPEVLEHLEGSIATNHELGRRLAE